MIILQREPRDCHNAAIATACGVSYEQASKATRHIDLPGPLESPVFSNPWNMYRAIVKLGFWKRNIELSDLLTNNYKPMKTIVLIHYPQKPTLAQHWIVLGDRFPMIIQGKSEFAFQVYWGDSETPCIITKQQLVDFYRKGWPNCAFQVYKANFWRLMWEKFKAKLGIGDLSNDNKTRR